MSQNSKEREYIDGVWMKNVWVSGDGESRLINMGFDKEKFIEQLQEMEPNEKGICNLTIGTQKSDPNKYSLFKDDFKPEPRGGGGKSKYPAYSGKGASKSTAKPSSFSKGKGGKTGGGKPTDDLPF